MEMNYVIMKIAIAILSAFVINLIVRKLIKFFMTRFAKKVSADATSFSFLKNSAGFIIFTIVAFYIIQQIPGLNNIKTALFASAGIFAAIIGFAAQKAFSNIIGGIFILVFRPFRVGDVIYIGIQYKGIVEEITLRHIIIRDYENRRIIIPNGIISDETIVNSSISDTKIKKHIEFNVDFNSDLEKAIGIIKEEAEKHPLTLDNRSEEQKENDSPKVLVRAITILEFSVKLRAYVWAQNNDDAFVISCDLIQIIMSRFKQEGIVIPYPYRNVVINK